MSVVELTVEHLNKLIDTLNDNGVRVVAPSKNDAGMVLYAEVSSATDNLSFDEVIGRYSPKDSFFPQTETLLTYRKEGKDVKVSSEAPAVRETVLLGVRPCDAAAMTSLNKIFTWDYIDNLFTERINEAIIISMACNIADEYCFCTSVGLAPDGKEGSDVLLRKTTKGDFQAEAVTEKGKEFISANSGLFIKSAQEPELVPVAEPDAIDIDVDKIKGWLDGRQNFDHEIWKGLADQCVGCGGCTFVCPTCHCFDIVDEPYGNQGKRVKNWDGCQFDHFTLHASGHNPRDTQPKRWRNRFHCKFKIYPDRFEKKGCVGCGRCIRVCPVGVDITEAMTEISNISA